MGLKGHTGPVIATGPLSRETESKLLSMLLQVAFDSRELVRGGWAKSPVFIDINQAGILKMQNHIWSMVAIHINETQCNRDQVIAISIELRAYINARFRCIAAGKFDHFETPIEIHSNEMARIAR